MPANPASYPKLFWDLRTSVNGVKNRRVNWENHIELTEWIQYQFDNDFITIATGPDTPLLTAENGLYEDPDNNVKLGGPLIEDTAITGAYQFTLGVSDLTISSLGTARYIADDFAVAAASTAEMRIGGTYGAAGYVLATDGLPGGLTYQDPNTLITPYTSNNGITLTSNNFQLGGTLSQNTLILGASTHNLNLGNAASPLVDLNLRSERLTMNNLQTFVTVGYLSLTSNGGTNPASLVLQQDGSSYEWELDCGDNHNGHGNAGDILVNQGSGILSWEAPTPSQQTYGAGGNNVTVSTSVETVVWKTAITGGGDTITLPDAASVVNRSKYIIVDTSGNAGTDTITINSGGGNISGSGSTTISANYDSKTFISDGTDWWII